MQIPRARPRVVAVTGATGFLGRHVVRRLLEAGDLGAEDLEVRCLVRPRAEARHPRAPLSGLGPRVSLVEGDVTRPGTLPALLEGAAGVVHLAGCRDFWLRDRRSYAELNEHGARHVFEAALRAGVDKVVQVSTPLAYGVQRDLPFTEEATAGPHPSAYALSKHRGDRHGWRLHRDRGLPLTVVHLAAVVGPGDPSATMEIRRVLDGRLPALVGADVEYTYLHVRDAAEAIVRALLLPWTVGRRYLVGGERATTRAYFGLIGEVAGVPVPSRDLPERTLVPIAHALELAARWTGRRPALPLDVLRTTAAGSLIFDGSRARRELGMRYRPLRGAIADAVRWIRTEEAGEPRIDRGADRSAEPDLAGIPT